MIKKIVKRFLLKIYTIGKYEFESRNKTKPNARVGTGTILDTNCSVHNQQEENRITIGNDCLIKGHLLVYNHGGCIEIGDHSFVGPDTRIWSAKEIKVGARVLISHNVNIHDNNSHPLSSKDRHEDFVEIFKNGLRKNANYNEKEIIIEDDVWIGFNSTIGKGVTIGKGAIVGSNTLVTKDVPPYAVIVGNPARIIKYTS